MLATVIYVILLLGLSFLTYKRYKKTVDPGIVLMPNELNNLDPFTLAFSKRGSEFTIKLILYSLYKKKVIKMSKNKERFILAPGFETFSSPIAVETTTINYLAFLKSKGVKSFSFYELSIRIKLKELIQKDLEPKKEDLIQNSIITNNHLDDQFSYLLFLNILIAFSLFIVAIIGFDAYGLITIPFLLFTGVMIILKVPFFSKLVKDYFSKQDASSNNFNFILAALKGKKYIASKGAGFIFFTPSLEE